MADEITQIERAVPFDLNGDDMAFGGFSSTLVRWVGQSAGLVPPWWSPQRDRWLRDFVADSGTLKVAVNTFTNKLVTIPWSIQAKDRSNLRHVRRAAEVEEMFRRNSGSMSTGPLKGFKHFLKMFIADYLQTDNGAFALVMGNGPSDRPIVGQPVGLLHLDSSRCTRTQNPEFPVRYLDRDGTWHKLHYTRVIEMSNLPSADEDMCGVGLCAVSCCLEAAQELWDIYRYNAERMGSRPPRQILYIKKGGTIKNLEEAIQHWQIKVDNQGKTHFGGTLLLAPARANQDLDLELIDLNRVPENFSRKDTTSIDMVMVAGAFGLDLRDLAYALGGTGQTKSDAEVQDRKGRGKGIGEFIETFAERFDQACLNTENWGLSFDNIDDEQDEQQARVRDLRSQGRERDLRSGVTTVRAEREMMWMRHEITQEMFEDMELLDGRLPNGLDVMLLFQSQDSDMKRWLDLGVPDPTAVSDHDPETMSKDIHDRIIELSQEINETSNSRRNRKARQALAALEKLRGMYQMPEGVALEEAAMPDEMAAGMEAEAVEVETESATTTESSGDDEGEEDTESEEKSLALDAKQAATYAGYDDIIEQDFRARMEELLEQAERQEIGREEFEQLMANLLVIVLTLLFMRGAGIESATAMTPAMFLSLQREIRTQQGFVSGLAEDLYAADYPAGIASPQQRLEYWVNSVSSTYYAGLSSAPEDPFLTWRLGIAEHCSTCLRLSGVTRRASEWRATAYRPRTTQPGVLECGGFQCKCYWERSEGPASGELPSAA